MLMEVDWVSVKVKLPQMLMDKKKEPPYGGSFFETDLSAAHARPIS